MLQSFSAPRSVVPLETLSRVKVEAGLPSTYVSKSDLVAWVLSRVKVPSELLWSFTYACDLLEPNPTNASSEEMNHLFAPFHSR
jgi:hypothetical protein